MKKVNLFLFAIAAVFAAIMMFSCQSNADNIEVPSDIPIDTPNDNPDDRPIGGEHIYTVIHVAILDELFQDRLNPESPAYLGEDYINGIKFFNMVDGQKVETRPLCYYDSRDKVWRQGFNDIAITEIEAARLQKIQPPYIDKDEEAWNIPQNPPYGYYFIQEMCPPFPFTENEDGRKVGYTYIQYPDGSEDTIKVRLYDEAITTILAYDKIWINGEVALDGMFHSIGEGIYNPKYYPWLEPVYKDNIQIGVLPKFGSPIVFITK